MECTSHDGYMIYNYDELSLTVVNYDDIINYD